MRSAVWFAGTTLMALAVAGLLVFAVLPYLGTELLPRTAVVTPTAAAAIPLATPTPMPPASTEAVSVSTPAATRTATPRPSPSPTPVPAPMTRIKVDSSVPIDAEVVVSPLVKKDGGVTWEVPSFKVGHAQYTAEAGEVGNAVLLGHLTSRGLKLGNVFQQLDRVRVGDPVEIFTTTSRYAYVVVETLTVPRTKVSVLDPTPNPIVSLITCTGLWNSVLGDYMERLVVRAELVRADQTPRRS